MTAKTMCMTCRGWGRVLNALHREVPCPVPNCVNGFIPTTEPLSFVAEEDEMVAIDSGLAELLQADGTQPPTFKLNKDQTVAVSTKQYWEPIKDCPRGVKVQLLGGGGVAVYGMYNGYHFWTHWAPVPARRPDDAETKT